LAANTGIAVSELGYNAELIGAAALVMENYERTTGKHYTIHDTEEQEYAINN